MVHAAVGLRAPDEPARDARRAPASIGPGATNMVTGAALAPRSTGCRCCCCPATSSPRAASAPGAAAARGRRRRPTSRSTTRFRPVSRYLDRIDRPEQLVAVAARGDARADRPGRDRRGHARAAAGRAGRGVRLPGGAVRAAASGASGGPAPEPERARASRGELIRAARAAADRRRRRRHLLPRPPTRCAPSPRRPASRSAETQAGKGSLPYDHPQALGAIGATGTTGANALAREADVVIGVGTRYSDFTTASRTAFQDRRRPLRQPQRRDVRRRQARARCRSSRDARDGARGARPRRSRAAGRRRLPRARGAANREWDAVVERVYDARPRPAAEPGRGDRRRQRASPARATSWSARPAACPATCTSCGARATRRATTSSTATRAWATRSPAALGVKLAAPDREVFVHGRRRLLPDDGPGDRHRGPGGRQDHRRPRSRTTASPRSARSRSRSARSASARATGARGEDGQLSGPPLRVDFAANAGSLGAHVIRARSIDELRGRAGRGAGGSRARPW